MSNLLESFNKHGYVIVPNVITADEVKKFRIQMKDIFDSEINSEQGDLKLVRSNIFSRFPEVQEYFFKQKIIDSLKCILGEDFIIMPEVSVMDSKYGGWHKDTTSIELFGQDFHKNSDFKVVNAALYLQDNTEHGGGLDVVPESHLKQDPYVEQYKNAPTKKKKEKGPQSLKEKIKQVITKSISNIIPRSHSLMRNRGQNKKFLASLPLAETDHHEGRFSIPSKAGDLVIFDLRLDHKASWPRTIDNFDMNKKKYVLFVICGANNSASLKYREYLNDRAKSQAAYRYLKNYTINQKLAENSGKLGIKTL
jgi:ectoine hydroxylase-related dioxygenase (phytanoyl-CoA dioxygenase family)